MPYNSSTGIINAPLNINTSGDIRQAVNSSTLATIISTRESSGWGSIGLGDLVDVDTETMPLRTGQLLGYNASTGNWEPIVLMSAYLQGGEVLVYNATSRKWVPTNPSNL